ncbi:hypothetical protein FOZ63_002973 [Perkinsus olseni]|uniref:Uncharacterized protein n=1 Tax=Perkinsus olseni TaxID=32597 RepID=A0A7J6RD35_PEROL|nr:hypothetical protein FOZ63_002973 [Perkinsus olseni]
MSAEAVAAPAVQQLQTVNTYSVAPQTGVTYTTLPAQGVASYTVGQPTTSTSYVPPEGQQAVPQVYMDPESIKHQKTQSLSMLDSQLGMAKDSAKNEYDQAKQSINMKANYDLQTTTSSYVPAQTTSYIPQYVTSQTGSYVPPQTVQYVTSAPSTTTGQPATYSTAAPAVTYSYAGGYPGTSVGVPSFGTYNVQLPQYGQPQVVTSTSVQPTTTTTTSTTAQPATAAATIAQA